MSWTVEKGNGIYLPEIDLRLDARKPSPRAYISHAHFDHFGSHGEVLCSPGTARLLQARLPGDRHWSIHAFNEPFEIAKGVEAELYPAGHIPGSSMLRLESNGSSLLYTGDFKLGPSSVAEQCVVPKADTLVMETTYGIPKYTFPPLSEVIADLIQFCRDTLDDDRIPVLFGYSLGKSQEILQSLADGEFEIMLHPQSLKMTRACEEIGFTFPPYKMFDPSSVTGHAVIAPPLTGKSDWLTQLPRRRTATISGWAIDPSAIYRNGTDRGFPLSDHSDYLELLDFVSLVSPAEIITTHGFAEEFARALSDRGFQARALGEGAQLNLGIASPPEPSVEARSSIPSPSALASDSPDKIVHFAETVSRLRKAEGHDRRVSIAEAYFSRLENTDVAIAALFLTGRSFPRSSPKQLTVDSALNRQALLASTGATELDLKRSRASNPGFQQSLLAMITNPDGSDFFLRDFQSLFQNLERAPNPVYQHSLLRDGYKRLGPTEALALSRIVTGRAVNDTEESVIEDALAARFGAQAAAVRRANALSSDMLQVANAAIDHLLPFIPLKLFFPVRLETSSSGQAAADGISILKKPMWSEQLYGGLHCQIHKVEKRVEIFDDSGNAIAHRFPEIVEAALNIPQDYVAEGSLVAWDKEKPLPCAKLEERLNRPAQDLFVGEDVDALLWLYDLFWFNGETIVDQPLSRRKRELDTFSVNLKIRISPVARLPNAGAIASQVQEAKSRGYRGIIVKDETRCFDPLSSRLGRFAFT